MPPSVKANTFYDFEKAANTHEWVCINSRIASASSTVVDISRIIDTLANGHSDQLTIEARHRLQLK
jgi:hypothetical protein